MLFNNNFSLPHKKKGILNAYFVLNVNFQILECKNFKSEMQML